MCDTTTGLNVPILAAAVGEVPRQLVAFFEWIEATDASEAAWALGLTVLGFVAGRIGARLGLGALRRAAERTEWKFDDVIVEQLAAPLRWTVPLLAVRALVPLFALSDASLAWISHALLVALILCVGWIAARFLRLGERYVAHQYRLDEADNRRAKSVLTKVRVLKRIAHFGVAVITVAGALLTFEGVRSLGAGLLASTGVVGVILGFSGVERFARGGSTACGLLGAAHRAACRVRADCRSLAAVGRSAEAAASHGRYRVDAAGAPLDECQRCYRRLGSALRSAREAPGVSAAELPARAAPAPRRDRGGQR